METEQQGTTIEETTVPQPEATSEEVTTEEEGVDTTLPSDVDKFEVPEKFKGKSTEDIAKAYVELEKMQQKDTQQPEDTKVPPEANPDYIQEYIDNGVLSEESYTKLEGEGYTREDIDDKIDYEKYKYNKVITEVTEDIGGVEEYRKVSEWLTDTMDPEELNTLSTDMSNTPLNVRKLIIKGLYTNYQQASGDSGDSTGDVIHTNENQYTSLKGYASQVELDEDMNDSRYGSDRAYTKAVEAKLGKTKNFDSWE